MSARFRHAALAATVLVACATNPATGRREFNLVSEEQEVQLGLSEAQKVRATMPALDNAPLRQLVESMGKSMAARSERPELPWSFTVLDDPVINAFALPGGPIFITRGILSHMNSEAELASVVGHEIGHVTARHSAQQMSRSQAAQLGLGVASILSPTAAQAAGLASQGLAVLFLKYGRDDESQSDALAYRYMLATNYDPREAVSMFRMLARTSGGDVAGRPPEWLSTHPDPGNREQAAQERLKSLDRDPSTMRRGRDEFLRLLDGLTFGVNPRDGFFRGTTFYQPDLNLQLAFPDGWRTENRPDAVVAGEPNGAAVISLQLAQGTPEEALRRFAGQQGLAEIREADYRAPLGATRSAAFSAQSEQGRIDGLVAFVGQGSRTYQLLGLVGGGKLQALDGVFRPVVSSLTTIADASIRGVQPARVRIVTLPRDMTTEEFLRAYPPSIPADQAMTVNGLAAGQRLTRGLLLKQVVGGVKE